MMERQVNHLVRLVDDLLEMSRITSGTIDLRKEHVEIATVIRSAVETSKPLIDAGGQAAGSTGSGQFTFPDAQDEVGLCPTPLARSQRSEGERMSPCSKAGCGKSARPVR